MSLFIDFFNHIVCYITSLFKFKHKTLALLDFDLITPEAFR